MDWIIPDVLAILRRSAVLLLQLMPYVLAGAALGAVLLQRKDRLLPDRLAERVPAVFLVFMSAVIGTVSPLCTMGAVPIVAGLTGAGLPLGSGVAFLTASSLANPQVLAIAFGTVGPALTAAQWASAVGIGVTAGLLGALANRRGIGILNASVAIDHPARQHQHEPTCPRSRHRGRTPLLTLFLDQLQHVLLYLIVGVVLASALSVWLPGGLMQRLLGQQGLFEVAAGAAASAPLYICGGGVLPTLAAFMDKGLAPGVVLAFIIAGPATRIQALAAVGAFIHRRALLIYLLVIWAWAIGAGLAFNAAAQWWTAG